MPGDGKDCKGRLLNNRGEERGISDRETGEASQ